MTRMIYACICLLLGFGPVSAQPTPSAKPPDQNLKKVKEPDLASELMRRADLDQECRKDTIRFMARHKLVEPVQTDKLDHAVAATYKSLRKKEQEVDRDNLAWIKRVVAKHGWPGKSLVGSAAAQSAFLLVQHAASDHEFMEGCLRKMEAAGRGEVEPMNLAYLTDRVLVLSGKKQKYGTQLTWKDGVLIVSPIEDEAVVDERRKAVGLGPLKDYLKAAEALYKNAEGVEPRKSLSKQPAATPPERKQP